MPFTKQEIFDTVAKAIIAQGRPSVDDEGDGMCRYRAPDGAKCAAGHLIPDDEYDPEMEQVKASWVAGRPPENHEGNYDGPISLALQTIVDDTGIEFVNRLQMIHDNAAQAPDSFVELFREAMQAVAGDLGLSTEVLDG